MVPVPPAGNAAEEALTKSEEILRQLDSMTGASQGAGIEAPPAPEEPQQPGDLLELLEKTKAAYLEKLANITAEIRDAQIAKLEASLKS